MNQAEKEPERPGKNPLIWVTIIVLGLIIYIFVGSDRGGKQTETLPLQDVETATSEAEAEAGDSTRQAPPTPGVIAREYIFDLRQQGKPYPFSDLMQRAADLSSDGSLADAHLLYFFAAREGHVAAMMTMAEMTDPLRFQPQNNLLDEANAIQAYKWYSQALAQGHEPAREHLDQLHDWARREAQNDNQAAQQLLLNFN